MSLSPKEGGEIFVLGYQGSQPAAEFFQLIENYRIGGIIFFERNIPSPKALQEQIADFKKSADHPLFFMVDQEGGKVNRLKQDFPTFPGNKVYGDKRDFQGAEEAFRVTARELKKIGINVNLAPVVDVAQEESNYMAERSFGTDPGLVSQFTKIAIEAIHREGIFACAKHFPGIGNLKQDPHEVLPVNDQSADEFRKKDFPSFQTAVKTGVELIMTTHVNCHKLDSGQPATFSRRIVTDILRKELGFEGLIITDDMEMGGMANYFEVTEACEKAFLAGHDLILICHSIEKQKKILEHFKQKIEREEIPQSRLQEALARVHRFKQRLVKHAVA